MIKKIISKKGSHVGVVVSFVIFITFLIFLYTIIQPSTVREKDKSYILDYLTLNILGNSTGYITTLTVLIEDQVPKECVKIQSIVSDIPDNEDLVFKNQNGDTLTYAFSGEGFLVEVGIGFNGYLKIYYSDILGSSLGTPYCPNGNTPITNVEPTLVKIFIEIFETKMYELNESYYEDYEGLKAYLGIPEGTEFNFYIYNSDRSEIIISAKNYEPPTDRSVFVEETPIQYSDENGNKMFGFLKVEVW